MVVRIRLARPAGHTRLTTWYDLVVTNARKPRDGKPIEKLGEYDPVPRILGTGPGAGTPGQGHKRIEWSSGRIQYWLDQGAQPSKSVVRLFERTGVLPLDSKYKGNTAARMKALGLPMPSDTTPSASESNPPSTPSA